MKRRILSVMLIFCMVLAIAPSALADDTAVFYVGDNQETTYTTLKEAVQALNGESKITLKSGTFTAGTENVSAIPGNVELVIEAGATAEVPANAVQTVLNSEGSIKVKAGGVLKLPNSAGVTEEWFGGALARMFVQSGAVTISGLNQLATGGCKWVLSEDASVVVPENQTAFLQFDLGENQKYGVEFIIPAGATVTVDGILRAVSGTSEAVSSSLGINGVLDCTNGTLSLAQKPTAAVGTSGCLFIGDKGITTTTQGDEQYTGAGNLTVARGGKISVRQSSAWAEKSEGCISGADGDFAASYKGTDGVIIYGASQVQNPEAAVGSAFYANINAAILDAEDGDTIVILDSSITAVQQPEGKNLTFVNVNGGSVSATMEFLNGGYPYANSLGSSVPQLVIEAKADDSMTYQWQAADNQDGQFTDIESAVSDVLTLSSAVSGKWYRCIVNGAPSKSVQILKIEDNKMDGCEVLKTTYTPNWWVSNGKMAYTFKSQDDNYTNIDILGKYIKEGTTYWMNTAYDNGWQLFTSTSAQPDVQDGNKSSGNAVLKSLRFAFDEANLNAVFIEAELGEEQRAFAFGADVMLGTNSVTSYADDASLKAIYKNGVLSTIQMVGALTVDKATDDDPAFVLGFTDSIPTHQWIGEYYDRELWTDNDDEGDNLTVQDGKVVEVSDIDSGLTVSWTGLGEGSRIRFSFSVGSVKDVGAEVNLESTVNSITVPNSSTTLYYAVFDMNGNRISDWKQGTGAVLVFSDNIQADTTYIVRAVNAGDFDDGNGEPNADAEYEFEGNITTPSDETGGVVDYVGYIVSTANPNNGTIDVNLSYALPGMVIKITAVPKEGYELSEIVVTDGAGNKIGFTKNDDGTYSFEMPNNQVYVAAEFAKVNTVSECSHDANCPASRFYDLELTAWYHDGVHYCVERGLMIGTSDVAFSPDASTTRGMIVAVLHRLENQPVVSQGNPFTDIKYGSYYEDAIAWAAANGIVEGYGDGSFEPDANITREQMATILYRYADYKGYDISVGGMSLYEYEDAVQISSYAVNAMQWANTEGLIEGRGNGNISPKDDATRAEIAAILMRFCENIAG